MNYKRILISLPVLYLFALLQSSFLVHFNLFGIVPNLILILIILWSFFEQEKQMFSTTLVSAAIGGFFLDVFSNWPFGFHILILSAIVLFVKFFIKQYVRIPFREGI